MVSNQHITLLTGYLWSNWTHVGFSVMFLSMGEKIRRSSGIHLSANLGKLLYTRPASSPATKAPIIIFSREMWPLVRQKTAPETSVRKTRALLEMTIFLSWARAGVTFSGAIFQAGARISLAFQKRTE